MTEQPFPHVDAGRETSGDAVASETPQQDRFRILKAADVVLIEDTTNGQIVGIDVLFGGVVTTQAGAMNVTDMLFEALCKTGFRLQAVTRLPVEPPNVG